METLPRHRTESVLPIEMSRRMGTLALGGEIAPTRIEGRYARIQHLRRAEYTGMSFGERERSVEMIAAIGLPVDNIRSLAHRRIHEDDNPKITWRTLATWEQAKGEFTTYDALKEHSGATRLATTIHELMHGTSPLREENTFMYGSQEKREAAVRFAFEAGSQALETRKFLNGYHRKLADELAAGEITLFCYLEEFSAILAELSLTNRNHVRQVQEAQHEALERKGIPGKVDLISAPNAQEPVGADRTLLNLIDFDGPRTVQGIEAHVARLKYTYDDTDEAYKVAVRADRHNHSRASLRVA